MGGGPDSEGAPLRAAHNGLVTPVSARLEWEIAAQRVIPVLRCSEVSDAVDTARACARSGMRVIELTRSIPRVSRAIERLRGDGLIVGLGTVTSPEQIPPAVQAGASFVVSFCAPDRFVKAAHDHDIVAIPGAMTPSEVHACLGVGADAVKIFPAAQMAPTYIRDLKAVMPSARLMVTGGIGIEAEALRRWLAAGAWAVGLGNALGTVADVGAAEVERRARLVLHLTGSETQDPPARRDE